MKKKLVLLFVFFSGFIYCQKIESPKDYFLRSKKLADSLNINYNVNKQIYNVDLLTDFKDRLLFDNNFKDQKKRTTIINEFRDYLPKNIDYNKVCVTEQKILDFYKIQTSMEYTSAYVVLRSVILSYFDDRRAYLEMSIINLLRKANYPVEKYNKLSEEEQNEVIKKIDEGYIFP